MCVCLLVTLSLPLDSTLHEDRLVSVFLTSRSLQYPGTKQESNKSFSERMNGSQEENHDSV